MFEQIISVKYLYSEKNITFIENADLIFKQLESLIENRTPLKLTFFLPCNDNEEYKEKLAIIKEIKKKIGLQIPFALICQAPANEVGLALEVISISKSLNNFNIRNSDNYFTISCKDNEILVACINTSEEDSFQRNVEVAFEKLNLILESTQFSYADIIRQWNYVEDILYQSKDGDVLKQNYQIFNDFRSFNYKTCQFINGYPVATGIGMTYGGCCIEIIAVKGRGIKITPVFNERQTNAHQYTEKVLIGKPVLNNEKLTSPKFERAKFIDSPTVKMLLVSGTASIIGEKTVCVDDIVGQTETTIENIKILLNSTLKNVSSDDYELLNYRAYVKKSEDCNIVKAICEKHYGDAPGIILISDICRDDLLVEIECNYKF